MEIRTDSIAFTPDKGFGPRTDTKMLTFSRNVVSASAVLTGTTFGFSPNDDHHLGLVNVKVDAQVLGSNVQVTATLGVRDWSGNWDDRYEGEVQFAVLAELV
jgi:hypothetical protein